MKKVVDSCQNRLTGGSGFTLIELLVTVVIVGLTLTFAVPAFREMVMNNRVLSKLNSLVNSLNYARNTALSQNVNTEVCPVGAVNSSTCGGNWQAGFMVIRVSASGARTLLKAERVGANDPTVSSTATNVAFDSRGIATTQANFTICDSRGSATARSVSVLPTGSVQSASVAGLAAWDGSALVCP